MEAAIIANGGGAGKDGSAAKSGIWPAGSGFRRQRLAHKRGMDATTPEVNTVPVGVIMQRTALDNPWASKKWEAHGIVNDNAPSGTQPRIYR